MTYIVMQYDMDKGAYVDIPGAEYTEREYRLACEFAFMLHVNENAMTILRMKED